MKKVLLVSFILLSIFSSCKSQDYIDWVGISNEWELLADFQTNKDGTLITDINNDSGVLKWNVDGIDYNQNDLSLPLSGSLIAAKLYGKESPVLSRIYVDNAKIVGPLDLTGVTELSSLSLYAFLNQEMTDILISPTVVGDWSSFLAYSCNLTGTLDLSMITSISNCSFYLFSNPNLTQINFSNSITGYVRYLYLYNCNLTGNLNLTGFSAFSPSYSDIRVHGNAGLTSLTINSSITGVIRTIYAYSCNLTGTLDLSMIPAFLASGAEIRLSSNPNLTSILLPASTGTISLFDASACDLGYINFSGIINLVKVDGCQIKLSNNNLTSEEVNHILYDLSVLVVSEASGGDYTGRGISIAGSNAAPDSSSGGYNGLAAKASLEAKGFIVTTN
ncbi:hypothetical protein [Sunxiuqinia indica]|uniref:hypothetical protein n=1 Tax=Sunxiuqinia indica TaxID=2692584 RepID=UPI00135719E4|nr:hypothetical protein [Sunxiuqinia indica]